MKYYGTNDGKEYGFSSKQSRFKTSIAITDKEHQELLQGQASGKQIKTDKDGHPYLADYDTTPTVEQQIAEQQRRLSDSDWYVTRYAETGKEIPAQILQDRQIARDTISKLRSV